MATRSPSRRSAIPLIALLGATSFGLGAEPTAATRPSVAALARSAAAAGQLQYKLTTPEELKVILGSPTTQKTEADGGMELRYVEYPGVYAIFVRSREQHAPFTLAQVLLATPGHDSSIRENQAAPLDIGFHRPIVLRNPDDLSKFDPFWGFWSVEGPGVSLANLDLREHQNLLRPLPFDSRTQWPPADRLPPGFDPARLLEDGKNPGLGVRGLHKQGIDGRGIHVAVIDQPIKPNHREYADRLVRYEPGSLKDWEPQMHGPPVASIAVGKTCGVAPAAFLSFFAIFAEDNRPYCKIVNGILDRNASCKPSDRVRVISISTGMFPQWPHYDAWKQTHDRATREGVLLLTCEQNYFRHAMLERVPGRDPDNPSSFRRAGGGSASVLIMALAGQLQNCLLVPAGERTTASHMGPEVYTYWREGGMSWATPYLAGVASLAYQVDPEIKPDKIKELLFSTASKTPIGQVVNPPSFIHAVRKLAGQSATTATAK